MLGAICSNAQDVVYQSTKGFIRPFVINGLTFGAGGVQLDLFTSTQAQTNGDGIEGDPILKLARKIMGSSPVTHEKPAINNNESGEQREVRKRNAFDIRRNGHKW